MRMLYAIRHVFRLVGALIVLGWTVVMYVGGKPLSLFDALWLPVFVAMLAWNEYESDKKADRLRVDIEGYSNNAIKYNELREETESVVNERDRLLKSVRRSNMLLEVHKTAFGKLLNEMYKKNPENGPCTATVNLVNKETGEVLEKIEYVSSDSCVAEAKDYCPDPNCK